MNDTKKRISDLRMILQDINLGWKLAMTLHEDEQGIEA